MGACRELFQEIGHFDSTFIEAHQQSNMICKVRSLKLQIKILSFLEVIITSSKEVFKDFESNRVVRIRKLGNSTWKSAESNVTVVQTAGS
jgi:hypothetical protein